MPVPVITVFRVVYISEVLDDMLRGLGCRKGLDLRLQVARVMRDGRVDELGVVLDPVQGSHGFHGVESGDRKTGRNCDVGTVAR